MSPKGFCGGEPHYRAARLRASIACQRYNNLAEDATPEERNAAWFGITQPDMLRNMSLATPPSTPQISDPGASSTVPSNTARSTGITDTAIDGGEDFTLLQEHDDDALDEQLPLLSLSDGESDHQPSATSGTAQPPIPDDPVYRLCDKRTHINLYPGWGKAPYVKGPIHIDYGTNLYIGSTTFINRGCMILDTPHSEVRIGEKCLIGPGVHFYGVTHPLDPDVRLDPVHPESSIAADIVLGDRCWIGGGAKILGGVTIGEGAVIGAGSVVTKSVPPYTVAYGVPARVRRHIPYASAAPDGQPHRQPFPLVQHSKSLSSACDVACPKHHQHHHPSITMLHGPTPSSEPSPTDQCHRCACTPGITPAGKPPSRQQKRLEAAVAMLTCSVAVLIGGMAWLLQREFTRARFAGGAVNGGG